MLMPDASRAKQQLMSELRQDVRHPFLVYPRVELVPESGRSVVGFASDVSAGGLRYFGFEPPTPGQLYRVHIDFPAPSDGQVVAQAHVIWCGMCPQFDFLEAGLRFVDPGPEVRKGVQDLVKAWSRDAVWTPVPA